MKEKTPLKTQKNQKISPSRYVIYELKTKPYRGTIPIPSTYLNRAKMLGWKIKVIWGQNVMIIDDLYSFVDKKEFPDKFGRGTYRLYYYSTKT